jgi:hypothetical protein
MKLCRCSIVLQSAACSCQAVVNALIDEVSNKTYRQHDTDHNAPSFHLSLDVDPQITAQMLIRVSAAEIGFAGVYVSFAALVKVVLSFIFRHDVTSLFECWVDAERCLLHLSYGIMGNVQYGSTDRLLTGKTYQYGRGKGQGYTVRAIKCRPALFACVNGCSLSLENLKEIIGLFN